MLLLFVISTNLYGQNGFLAANHSYQINGDELRVYLKADFSLGYGICDFLDTCYLNISNDTVLINALYDISGFHPQVGCTSYDTIDYKVPYGNYSLIIDSEIIFVDSVNTIDTINVSSQLFQNLILAINEDLFVPHMILYPIPAKDVLQLEVSNGLEIERINLINLNGQVVREYRFDFRELDVSFISSGNYILEIITDQGGITKKITIK